jgi:hypothetical protein
MSHKKLSCLWFFPERKKLTKSLSWLCVYAQWEKKSHFTPYNNGVKLLIIRVRRKIVGAPQGG